MCEIWIKLGMGNTMIYIQGDNILFVNLHRFDHTVYTPVLGLLAVVLYGNIEYDLYLMFSSMSTRTY